MLGKISELIDPVTQAINNKLVNMVVAAGVAGAGKIAQESSDSHLKTLSEIPVAEIFQHPVSAASAVTYIGSAYIILQFIILIAKGVIWLWGKVRK